MNQGPREPKRFEECFMEELEKGEALKEALRECLRRHRGKCPKDPWRRCEPLFLKGNYPIFQPEGEEYVLHFYTAPWDMSKTFGVAYYLYHKKYEKRDEVVIHMPLRAMVSNEAINKTMSELINIGMESITVDLSEEGGTALALFIALGAAVLAAHVAEGKRIAICSIVRTSSYLSTRPSHPKRVKGKRRKLRRVRLRRRRKQEKLLKECLGLARKRPGAVGTTSSRR